MATTTNVAVNVQLIEEQIGMDWILINMLCKM